MELITSVTVGSGGAASVTLPASGTIPATYTDLKIVVSARLTGAYTAQQYGLNISFNGSSSNFTNRYLYASSGTTVASTTGTTNLDTVPGASATANTFNNAEVYIPNYTSTTNAKSFSFDNGAENNSATNNWLELLAGLWNPGTQAAITTITLTAQASNIAEGSTFYLYGISAVTSTPKATGGIISQDATYWYHTFPFTSTFTPTTALSNVDYLCIAGGAGGGAGSGTGGGGAGGLRSTVDVTGGGGTLESKISLNSGTAYTITVGAGGTGGVANTNTGNSGGNSSIAGTGLTTITSTGGGGGGSEGSGVKSGGNGGSGGGSSYNSGAVAGTGTANQGYAGGTGAPNPPIYNGGGGGGAGAVGANAGTSTSTGANGGAGVAIPSFANATFTGVATYYAGGGGGSGQGNLNSQAYGGTGGVGGGGTGAGYYNNSSGILQISGTVNTGSGGGAGGAFTGANTGASGGSGLVILRYAK